MTLMYIRKYPKADSNWSKKNKQQLLGTYNKALKISLQVTYYMNKQQLGTKK